MRRKLTNRKFPNRNFPIFYARFIKNPMKYVQVDEKTGCWIWLGNLRPDGHGRVSTGNYTHMPAHKWFYEQKYGSVPSHLELDHIVCDNPPCCNPDHVQPTTPNENMNRGKPSRNNRFGYTKSRTIMRTS